MRHQSNRLLLTVALACLLGAQATYAQVAPGQRIRIVQGVHALTEGVYLGRDSLGYAVLLAGNDTVRVPMDGSYKAERFMGRAPHGIGALGKGLAIGAGAGLVVIGLNALSPSAHERGVANAVTAIAAVAFTAVGAMVGAITAAVDHDIWLPVTFTPETTKAGESAAGG